MIPRPALGRSNHSEVWYHSLGHISLCFEIQGDSRRFISDGYIRNSRGRSSCSCVTRKTKDAPTIIANSKCNSTDSVFIHTPTALATAITSRYNMRFYPAFPLVLSTLSVCIGQSVLLMHWCLFTAAFLLLSRYAPFRHSDQLCEPCVDCCRTVSSAPLGPFLR